MSVFDVRDNGEKEISRIVFADKRYMSETTHAYEVIKSDDYRGCVALTDDDFEYENGGGYVLCLRQEHAENLFKALEKAIEIGWLK